MAEHKPSFVQRALARWADLVQRRAGAVLLGSIVLTGLAVWTIVSMFDIRSDLKDILPENTASVVETFEIAERMGSITPLTIIVEAPDTALPPAVKETPLYRDCRQEAIERARQRHTELVAIAEADGLEPPAAFDEATLDLELTAHCDNGLVLFARDLVDRLAELDLIGYVHYRNDKTFFEDHVLLYASVEDLERLYTDIDEALTDARDQVGQYKACLIVEGSEEACEHLAPSLRKQKASREAGAEGASADASEAGAVDDFSEEGLRRRYAGGLEDSEIEYNDEYMLDQLPDGNWVIKVNVRFRDATTSLKANEEAQAAIDEVIAEIEPERFHPDMKVVYGGGFRTQKEQYDSTRNDIIVSSVSTVGGILLLLLIFFRRFRATFIVMLPLLMSIAWTLALTFLVIGYLNIITAFIVAILLGLGIDFGIHLLARYDEALSRGRPAEEAMTVSVSEVGAANLAGALTTSATFATLMTADFRGFSQFGLVAAMGVLVALFVMVTVLPALTIFVQRRLPAKPRSMVGGTAMPSTGRARRLVPLALGLLVTVVTSAVFAATHADQIQFEENFYRLQMRHTEWKADENRYRVTEDRHSSPAIVLAEDLTEVHALEQVLDRRKDPHVVKDMREVARLYPNLFGFVVEHFGTAISYSDEHAVAPALMAARRVLPESFGRAVPEYTRFDASGTRALHRMRDFVTAYPHLAERLSDELIAKPLRQVERYRALPVVVAQHRGAPAWLQPATAARVNGDRLTSVKNIVSIFSFMPGTEREQQAKLEVIERIRERTKRRNIRFLPKDEQADIRDMRRYLVGDPIDVDDLPDWVKQQFKEGGTSPAAPREGSGVDYAFGNVALVYQSTSSQVGSQARRFTHEMRSLRVTEGDDSHRPIMATNAFVFADMLDQIERDGLDVSWLALAIVLLVVFAQHRSVLQTIVVIAPLAIALCWVAGLMELFDIKLSFFNIVIIPVIIGIGIDDGIHHYHRYREEGRGGLWQSLRYTGGAMFATSATTCVGFGGMLLSQHQGLNSMGELALIGIACAWLATVTIQPALILLAERFELRAVVPDKVYDPAKLPSL